MDLPTHDQQAMDAERELLMDNIRLRGIIGSLCGFASTARRVNNPEWMHNLCDKINFALDAIGDTDTIHWDEKVDWIYTSKELNRYGSE